MFHRPPISTVKTSGHPKQGLTTTYNNQKSGQGYIEPSSLLEHFPHLTAIPIQTKIMRVSGLHPGGYALIDKKAKAKDGSLIAVDYNGQTIIRRLTKRVSSWWLIPDDPREENLPINDSIEIHKIGVVVAAITNFSC